MDLTIERVVVQKEDAIAGHGDGRTSGPAARTATGSKAARRTGATGIARRRRPPLGQHFLADGPTIARIVDALAVRAGDLVVEIGPGRGALTSELVLRGVRVAAIEVDPRLAAALRGRLPASLLHLVEGDVRSHDLGSVARSAGADPDSDLLVVANLPYAVSKPVAQKIVTERDRVLRAVLMFQREVAERLTALPGQRAYGPLSVLCGAAFDIEKLFDVHPRAFRPPPQVASSVTRWTRRSGDAGLDPRIEPALRACLTACFARRRQTLRNNLRAAVGSADLAALLLDAAGLDGDDRAERIDRAGFHRLASAWRDARLL